MKIIVYFEEENCVEVVPDFWYKNGCCAWPKKSIKNYKKYINRRIKPNEIDFDYFKTRAMSNNIGKVYTNYLPGFTFLMLILLLF
jgi:hypothetical protein